jgi:hypothetical protein
MHPETHRPKFIEFALQETTLTLHPRSLLPLHISHLPTGLNLLDKFIRAVLLLGVCTHNGPIFLKRGDATAALGGFFDGEIHGEATMVVAHHEGGSLTEIAAAVEVTVGSHCLHELRGQMREFGLMVLVMLQFADFAGDFGEDVDELGLVAGLPRVEFEEAFGEGLQEVVYEGVVLGLLVLIDETVV